MTAYCLVLAETLDLAINKVTAYLKKEGFDAHGKFANGPASGGFVVLKNECSELTREEWDINQGILSYEGNYYATTPDGETDFTVLLSDFDGMVPIMISCDIPIEDYEDRIGQLTTPHPYVVVVEY